MFSLSLNLSHSLSCFSYKKAYKIKCTKIQFFLFFVAGAGYCCCCREKKKKQSQKTEMKQKYNCKLKDRRLFVFSLHLAEKICFHRFFFIIFLFIFDR